MAVYRIPIEIINPNFPSNMANVWHGRTDTTDDFWDPVDETSSLLGALKAFYTVVAGVVAKDTKFRFPTAIVDVTDPAAPTEVNVTAIPDITSSITTLAPKGLSLCVSWRTSLRARRGRGRQFLGPMGDGMLDPNTGLPYEPNRLVIQDAVDDLVAASTAVNGWALGVYGQETAGVAEPKVLRDFVAGDVAKEFSLLRSRRD